MQKQREKRSTITLGFKRSNKEEVSSTKISSSGMTLLEERQKFLREAQAKSGEQSMHHRHGLDDRSRDTSSDQDHSAPAVQEQDAVDVDTREMVEVVVPDDQRDTSETGPETVEAAENNAPEEKEKVTKFERKSGEKSGGGSGKKVFQRRDSGSGGKKNIYDASRKFDERKRPSDGGYDRDRVDRRNSGGERNRDGDTSQAGDSSRSIPRGPGAGDTDVKLSMVSGVKSSEPFSGKKSVRGDGRSKTSRGDFEEGNPEKLDKKISKDRQEKYSKNIHTYIFNEEDDENSKNGQGKYNRLRRREKRGGQSSGHSQQKIFKNVNIPEFVSVSDLADRMNEKKSNIIRKLLTMGVKATVNQIIDADTAELIVIEFGHSPNRVSDSDIENVLSRDVGDIFMPRNPIVTVMGHVDHGKTSLLDALRTTNIAESESGGITQHIGASRVDISRDKFITFIDTPGHEAFTEMRIRGANVTDIVILVVAADDGIKDQTIEAINHTKAAKVPIIVAINKIDRIGANPDKVKQDLLQYGVVAAEFGGNVIFVNVSAKDRTNLDKLMEAILFQAEILDLKAPIGCGASGAVIESKMDVQRGAVTTVLVQRGVLNVGDIVLAGTNYGKIKKIIDDRKKVHESAYPSMAVEVLGLDGTPSAGVIFNVVSTEKEARDIISYRERRERESREIRRAKGTIENILKQVKDGNRKQLSLILKTDASGSTEAIAGSLMKLETGEVSVEIVHSAIGSVSESDVNLALTSDAIVVAFNVRANGVVKDMARERGVEIKYYSIIYDIVNDVKSMMSGLLDPLEKEKIIGQAEIREVIRVSGVGKVAGCFVTDGEMRRNSSARIIRNGIVIFDGKIKTLRRFKEDVREVKNNYECGIVIENYDNIVEKDLIECYEKVLEKR
ncbi:MAG: translation initiation factor IF-2 [Rickettsiales bacterium]|jgi:translation initiation factor IF-2|nr:translation initiation factor IF-2 [Rickettsiales bacterium]